MKKSLIILGALLCAYSCSKEAEGTIYRPNSDDGKEIHFSVSSLEKVFGEEDKAGLLELSLVRPGTKGTHRIQLAQMGSDEELFSFPEYVTIKDGEYYTVVPVVIDLKKCVKGSAYNTSIYIVGRDQATGNYGVKNAAYSDAVAIKASIELTWLPLMVEDPQSGEMVQQTATYYYNSFWSGFSDGLLVEKAECEENIYRVSDWGTSGATLMWMVNEDNSCTLPKQNTGYFNSTYGQYIFVSDYPSNGTSSTYTYKNYPCSYDGKNTYTFNVIYWREGSTGNFGKGVETLVFDSAADRRPEVSIVYEGVDSTATGFIGARIRFTPNKYTRKYDVRIYDGNGSGRTLTKELTLYEEMDESWNLSRGPHTITAVGYDEDGNAGETKELVFTFDPENSYGVKVDEFTFSCDSSVEEYDPTGSLHYHIRTRNLTRGWYTCMKKTAWESSLKKQTIEELLIVPKDTLSASKINGFNSAKGYTGHYGTGSSPLSAGTTYVLAMILENAYGDRVTLIQEATTQAKDIHSGLEDFETDVTIDDFLGSYLFTAGVGSNATSAVDMTYRVDISKMDANRVVISGLASPIVDFDPMVTAYYDATRHCLVFEPQNVGKYDGAYAQLAMYTGSSYVYASGAFLLGKVGDSIAWVSDPTSSYSFKGYTFMMFSALPASSTTYMKQIVASKVFINPEMDRLETAVSED